MSVIDSGSEATEKSSILVVGGGMVSWRFVRSLTESAARSQYRVRLFGEEPWLAYNRVRLTDYFQTPDPKSLELSPQSWYEERHIEAHVSSPIVRIHRDTQEVEDASGHRHRYDKLVLATGSLPSVPHIEGADLPGVYVYRTIRDVEGILEKARVSRRCLVIGGGLLGLEAADAFRSMGLDTVVAQSANGLLCRQLNEEASSYLLKEVARLGIRALLPTQTQRIEPVDGGLRVTFDRWEAIDVDFVVIATGIRPRDELARQCDLAVAAQGGVVIDEELRTSDPNIYAIGECVWYRGQTFGLVAPGYKMADALASSFAGRSTGFDGADLSSRLKLVGVEVSVFGEYLQEGTDYVYRGERVYRSLVVRGGRLVGATVLGAWAETVRLERAVRDRISISDRQCERFQLTGELFGADAMESMVLWPDNAVVCNCVNVSCGTLKQAIASGRRTIAELQEQTGAGSVCGSCIPELASFTGDATNGMADYVGPKGGRWLLVSAAVAVVLILAYFIAGPAPVAESVQSAYYRLSQLWQGSVGKQISGFTLMGTTVVALGLSARKRFRWLRFGNFGFWRVAHSVLGAVTIVGLALHTGLSTGSNLNLWLFVCFLGLNLSGALTALAVADTERFSGSVGRRLRRMATWGHIYFFIPYPVLLAFHIFKFYRY